MILPDKLAAGRCAEQIALRFLQAQGLAEIAINYRCRWGEIDLICAERDSIVFIEVRYRNTLTKLHPEETVEFRKQQRLIRTAMHYLQHNYDAANKICRFDVIAINGDLRHPNIGWYRDAFQCSGW